MAQSDEARLPPALDDMIREIDREAHAAPNRLTAAIVAIHAATGAEADPYVLVGVMLEAIATVVRRAPADARHSMVIESIRLLLHRLRDHKAL